jgi:hypothetical protein
MWASLTLWTWSIGCHCTRETKLRDKRDRPVPVQILNWSLLIILLQVWSVAVTKYVSVHQQYAFIRCPPTKSLRPPCRSAHRPQKRKYSSLSPRDPSSQWEQKPPAAANDLWSLELPPSSCQRNRISLDRNTPRSVLDFAVCAASGLICCSLESAIVAHMRFCCTVDYGWWGCLRRSLAIASMVSTALGEPSHDRPCRGPTDCAIGMGVRTSKYITGMVIPGERAGQRHRGRVDK